MQVPKDAQTINLTRSIAWLDSDGILYSVPRPGAPAEIDLNKIKSELKNLREFLNHKKVCIVMETNKNSKAPSKEYRDLIADELSKVTKALAVISSSPLSRMIANLFFGLKPPPYPVKMFTDEKEAKRWIRQFV